MGLKSLKRAIKNPFKATTKTIKSMVKPKNLLNFLIAGPLAPAINAAAKYKPRKWNVFARAAGSYMNLLSKATEGEKPYYGYAGLGGDMQDKNKDEKAFQEQLAALPEDKRAEYQKWLANPAQYQEQLAQFQKEYAGFNVPGRFSKYSGGMTPKRAGEAIAGIDQSLPGSYASQAGEARTQEELKRRRYSGTLLTSPSSGALAQAAGGSSGKTLLGQ